MDFLSLEKNCLIERLWHHKWCTWRIASKGRTEHIEPFSDVCSLWALGRFFLRSKSVSTSKIHNPIVSLKASLQYSTPGLEVSSSTSRGHRMIEGFLCRCYNALTLQRSHLWRLCEIETVLRVVCFPLAKLFQAHNSESKGISDLCKDNDHVRKADKEEVQQLLAPGTHKYTSDLKSFFVFPDFKWIGST